MEDYLSLPLKTIIFFFLGEGGDCRAHEKAVARKYFFLSFKERNLFNTEKHECGQRQWHLKKKHEPRQREKKKAHAHLC